MQYLVYDQSGKKQMLLQNVTSIQWNPKYWESGTAEIHARPTTENVQYLVEHNRVVCQDRNEIMFIDYVQRSDQNDDGDDMIIHGYLDNLDARINTNTLAITDAEQGLRKLVTNNKRGLDINLAEEAGLGVKVTRTETTWETLRSTFETICQTAGLGWREVMKDGQLNTIEIYQGKTREGARFSDNLGNIVDQELTKNLDGYGNYLYVLGEETDTGRTQVILDKRIDGEPTLEAYIDARDLQSTYTDDSGEEQTYTDDEYKALLTARGESKYADMLNSAYSFTCIIQENNELNQLGTDYDLGDLVPIISKRFGVLNLARITGIKFVEEQNTQTQTSLELTIEKQEILK